MENCYSISSIIENATSNQRKLFLHIVNIIVLNIYADCGFNRKKSLLFSPSKMFFLYGTHTRLFYLKEIVQEIACLLGRTFFCPHFTNERNLLEIVMGELKSHGELVYQLVNNVKKLQEDGQEARVLGRVVEVASQVEPVPERHPLLLD